MGDYRGRIAPSPTGHLHLGHAKTFWTAWRRCREASGVLVLRNEDLDSARCRPEFVQSIREDLRRLGIDWQEGPDCGGPHAPYNQSERRHHYLAAWTRLRERGFLYPCKCSRKELRQVLSAPQQGEEDPLYPGTCRLRSADRPREKTHWRFRVPSGERIEFVDLNKGRHSFEAGKDFGDFVIWRQDDIPAYQLAVVVDDHEMKITEVVRGEDLLLSTARQILLYRALGWSIPDFYHVDLVKDETGSRLSKRHGALSLRELNKTGADWKALLLRQECGGQAAPR